MARNKKTPGAIVVRREGDAIVERSTCGERWRLLSREDEGVAAWAHAVEIDGARPHYHRRASEIYYVLEGSGVLTLDGVDHAIEKGTTVHIPPDVVHGARGKLKLLVIGVPDIRDDDVFFPEED